MSPDQLRANPPVLMSEREVASFIGICPRSVRNFTARGLLPVIRLGRRRLFRRDAVIAALRALEEESRIGRS
jgi:excisionase family DNA binding protein